MEYHDSGLVLVNKSCRSGGTYIAVNTILAYTGPHVDRYEQRSPFPDFICSDESDLFNT
jgi:hypothetical protein